MTMTKGQAAASRRVRPAADAPARRSHVPADGTANAAAVEAARRAMLDDARPRHRTRIGADVVCEALLLQGVDVFFSYPGGVILPLYDVLGDYPELRHVLVRHEQGGAHAADGYARVTGQVGVCMGTSGPGRDEPRDRDRHRPARLDPDGRDHRQRPVRPDRQGRVPGDRHQRHHPADDEAQLPRPRRRTTCRASSPRPSTSPAPAGPGPVHVDITKDALQQETTRAAPDPRRGRRRACPASARTSTANGRQLKLAAAEIAKAKRPVILAGHGVLHAEAWDELRRLRREGPDPGRPHAARHRRDRRDASAELRLHGHARLEARQPGDPVGRPAVRDRDALRRPGHRQRPDLRAVRPDRPRRHRPGRDRQERRGRGPDRRRRRSASSRRSCRWSRRSIPATRADYFAELAEWRRDSEGASWHGSGAWRDGLLSADYVVERIGELTDHEATYVADVGQNQMWLARYAGFRHPNTHVSSGGLGTMGFSVPAAMGAALGAPGPRDLGDHRRRRLPDDVAGADDPRRRTGSR